MLKNFFQQIPDGLEDSAKIDGRNDLGVLIRIVLPLSRQRWPRSVCFTRLLTGTRFNAILYINDNEKWPIQVLLREIVILAQSRVGDSSFDEMDVPLTIRMAVIVLPPCPFCSCILFCRSILRKASCWAL